MDEYGGGPQGGQEDYHGGERNDSDMGEPNAERGGFQGQFLTGANAESFPPPRRLGQPGKPGGFLSEAKARMATNDGGEQGEENKEHEEFRDEGGPPRDDYPDGRWDDEGPPPHWGGGRGGGPPPFRGRGGFMRGRGGFDGPRGPPPRGMFPPGGPGPNGFGPRGPGGPRGGFGPRGGPPPGWGDPNFGPPPGMGGPPPGMGGPPPGMMPPWGDGPPPGWGGPGGPRHGAPHGNFQPEQSSGGKAETDLSGDVWVETKTEEGKSYFYNARTRETTWTKPEGNEVKILSQSEVEEITKKQESERQQDYGMPPPGFNNGSGGQYGYPPPWAGGAQCDWTEHTAPDGKKYYHNSKTQESVWEKPKAFADFEARQKGGTVSAAATTSAAAAASTNGDSEKSAEPKASPNMEAMEAKLKEAITGKPAETQQPASVVPISKPKETAADRSKPVSSTPVPGTPWCVVWTGDRRVFFFNPTTKTSVWDRPPELVGREDVDKMLKSPAAAKKQLAGTVVGGKLEESDEEPDKPQTELLFEDDLKERGKKETSNEEIVILEDSSRKTTKNAAMQAEVKAAKERQLVPLETRMTQFKELLQEKEISAFSTWEKELHKIVFDPRYLLLTSKERKQVFDKYVRERADEERREKKNRIKERKENFVKMLQENKLPGKMSFSEFASKFSKDERYRAIEKMRERESLFNEHMSEIRRKEKEERAEKRDKAKKEFLALLKETSSITRHSRWSEIKKSIDTDPRYKAVDSSAGREDYFLDYVHELKDNHRREKDSKKKSKHRSRSRSRSRRRDRSRSRSRDRSSKKDKKKDKKKDRDEEKEEGEMSDDDQPPKKKSRKESEGEKDEKKENDDESSEKPEKKEEEEKEEEKSEEDKEKMEKEARIAASIKRREEEVQRELSGHLYERDKEREQHRHAEAIQNFQALLTDLIKTPDFAWKEAKKLLKKDSRYDKVSDNLDKSERERLFDDHIDALVAKKKDNFWKMLDELSDPTVSLTTTFSDVRGRIKDDPRYSKYSSSDRKCEKQFNEYLKERLFRAKVAFRELLVETRQINDKSLSLVKEEEGHLTEIEELLAKDRRYLELDSMSSARKDILMTHLEELERRGPPPPPTASEPSRRPPPPTSMTASQY